MNKSEVRVFLDKLLKTAERNIVIIDFSNVTRWEEALGWRIDIGKLRILVSHMTKGRQFLRRFYYGQDYGPNEKSIEMVPWSAMIHRKAQYSGFEIITKRVKYIVDITQPTKFNPKCDLDIEMVMDLICEEKNYDNAIIFSGDGDLAPAYKYLHEKLGKKIYVFAARDRIGKEVLDGLGAGFVEKILFTEDFEYRLELDQYQSKTRSRGF